MTRSPYGYVDGNPLNGIDPFGLTPSSTVPSTPTSSISALSRQNAGCSADPAAPTGAMTLNDLLETGQILISLFSLLEGVPPEAPAVDGAAEEELSGTALARHLGTSGEDLAGIDQAAKVRIPSLTNSAAYRIPDSLTETTLTEVKNVSYLSYTSQIQDFSYYATQTGRQFNLIVRADILLSGPLEDIVNMMGSPINLIRGLPAL